MWADKRYFHMHCFPDAESALCDTRYNFFYAFSQNVLMTRVVWMVCWGTDPTVLEAKTGRWFFWNDEGRVLGR